MGKIISEDATNIHFPQTCDVLVDDVDGLAVERHDNIIRTIHGVKLMAYRAINMYNNVCCLVTQKV